MQEYKSQTPKSEKQLEKEKMAEDAVRRATLQISACYEFKKSRMARITKYYELYDGKTPKKLRQLFNVAIPVFPGMIDTLNAQYDTPIILNFKEGGPEDYFKVKKVNAAFEMEVMDSNKNSKWESKLRMARKDAIMSGVGIVEYRSTSDPEYKSELTNIDINDFNFQPEGGYILENHLFAGVENVEKTKAALEQGAEAGIYDKEQVKLLVERAQDQEYLPDPDNMENNQRLARFKPLGLDPSSETYVGEPVFRLAEHILNIKGERYYLCFHPWTKTWLRFEKWKDLDSSGLYPWKTFATHPDKKNFLSKSYADDLYPAADAIVAMFNQELTNREKRNFGARAYDKDMFKDVRKLDEAMHRPDALVPADTKGGTKQIAGGIFEFKTGELQGTVNLIDWITGSLGRNTGATDLAMGGVQQASKKASVTFAEQKSVSKRIGWGAQPFQDMMADLGKAYLWGLKDHMPSKMAIRIMGEGGWDWDEITRLDLDTEKDVDVFVESADQKIQESEMKKERRVQALKMIDPVTVNPQKLNEEILMSVGEYDDAEIAEFLDLKTYQDRKALAKAAEAIQLIMMGKKPEMWYGANIAFIQKIVDVASDKRATLGPKFQQMIDYAMAHEEIAKQNIERKMLENQSQMQDPQQGAMPGQRSQSVPGQAPQSQAMNPGLPGGMSKALEMGENAIA